MSETDTNATVRLLQQLVALELGRLASELRREAQSKGRKRTSRESMLDAIATHQSELAELRELMPGLFD